MPPDPARKLVAFGHSGTLSYKVIRLLIWDYFVLSLVAMCYSTAGTTYSFFDPVLGPHLQSVRFYKIIIIIIIIITLSNDNITTVYYHSVKMVQLCYSTNY